MALQYGRREYLLPDCFQLLGRGFRHDDKSVFKDWGDSGSETGIGSTTRTDPKLENGLGEIQYSIRKPEMKWLKDDSLKHFHRIWQIPASEPESPY